MYTVTRTVIRPSVDIDFYNITSTPDVLNYFLATYYNVSMYSTTTYSDDYLEKVTTMVFSSLDKYLEFKNDPYMETNYFSITREYESLHNFTVILDEPI